MRNERLTFACMSTPRIDNLRKLLDKVLPYVDEVILVIGRLNKETVEWVKTLDKVTCIYRPWDDNFTKQWETYLKYVKNGWILICDDDEIPSDEMLKSLDDYINKSYQGNNYCCVQFQSQDVSDDWTSGPTGYYRQILFRKTPQMRYQGGSKTGCHQYLVGYQNNKHIKSEHVYFHNKSPSDGYRNAARNYFIYGLWPHGSKDGIQKEDWHEMKSIVKECYPNVKTFMQLNDLFITGNINLKLKIWIISNYKKFKEVNGYNELCAIYKYYFEYLHPEEL